MSRAEDDLTPKSASVGKVDDSALENGCRKNLERQYIGSKAKPSRSMMAAGNKHRNRTQNRARDPVSLLQYPQHSPLQASTPELLCSSPLSFPSNGSLYIAVMFTTPRTLTLITTPPPRCFSNLLSLSRGSAEPASSSSYSYNSPPNSRQRLKSFSLS